MEEGDTLIASNWPKKGLLLQHVKNIGICCNIIEFEEVTSGSTSAVLSSSFYSRIEATLK